MEVDYNEAKFRELLLYAASRLADDPAGGAIKLNKVLFFAEFAHVRAHGRPITGAAYQRLEWGPAPRRLLPVRRHLVETGQARLEKAPYLGLMQDRLVPLREPDVTLFDDDELKLVDQVVAELHGRSGTEASLLSHDELGWQLAEDGEDIPYETAFLRQPVVTEAVRRRIAELAAEHSI